MADTIFIHPQKITINIIEDKSLLETFQEKDIYVKSSCGGFARCRDCVIKILEGKENLTDPTFEEKQLLGNVFHMTQERLSCQTKAVGSISVDLSDHNPSNKKIVPKKQFKVRKKIEKKQKKYESETRHERKKDRRPRPFRTD